ncbi:MAG TPA: energy transducer TonB [Vicinamibacteria bacterium]|nr:energy transducer TonB [Vicinamibacteria bacterium]
MDHDPLGSLLAELRQEQVARARVGRRQLPQAGLELPGEFPIGPSTPVSPFGGLLDELRRRPRQRRADAEARATPPRAPRPAVEPTLQLETRIVTAALLPSRRRLSWLLPMSVLIHATLGLSAAVLRLMTPEPLPIPAGGVRAFLVEPPGATPPPPPPAPAPKGIVARRSPDPPPDRPKPALTAPREEPEPIAPEPQLDLAAVDGVAGGVEGGVPGGTFGGIVGGIVGDLPPTPPPPRPPVRLEKGVKEPRKVKHVDPRYPEIAARANVRGIVVLECLVSPQGRVTELKVLRSSNPLLDEAAVEAVKQWVYTPTLVDGVPVAVIFTVTVQFQLN